MGELDTALQHTEEGIARYCAEEHHWLTFVYGGHDPGLCAKNLNAILLCLKGYPDQARERSVVAVAQAEELGHPYTLLEGLFCGLIVGLLQADLGALERDAGVLNKLARDGKLPAESAGLANGFLGWAMAEQGQSEDGLELMRNSAETWRSFWGAWCFPLDAAFAAVLSRDGHGAEALQILDQAVSAVEEGGGHWWDAEFYRVRGEALSGQGQSGRNEAEACFVKAMECASANNAMFLKLRAARSLAEHKIDAGDEEQAEALLRPVYDWFSEGFDMPDMLASKALLERLS
jgi:tetratricopeptide (TPR) repeat protein